MKRSDPPIPDSEATHLAVRYHASTWQRYREECERRNLEECRIPFCSCRLSPRPENECDKRMRGRLQVRDALRRAVA